MKGISKQYAGNRVLKNVSLQLKPGEIHAVLGENGAGKSTLMNILFGMSVIHSTGGYEGEILIDGQPIEVKSPYDAMNLGIGMVHQEFMLIPGFTITENIKVNREITKHNVVSRLFGSALKSLDMDAMNKDARKALDTVGMNIDEWVKVAGLPVGYMQFVEIAREIDKSNVKVLVFDEPTAVLTESEASTLLNAMKAIAESGIAILFITHRLDEVMTAADNITVLRDGELVRTLKKQDTNTFQLAELMVGREIQKLDRGEVNISNSDVALSVRGLRVLMPGEEVRKVDLDVYQGEILGIGGLGGQGKIGIANGIMGLYPAIGEVVIKGAKLALSDTRAAYHAGLAFVSEDRRGVGLLLDSSIELNIAFTAMQMKDKFLKKFGLFSQVDSSAIRQHALKMIKGLDIRCTGPTQLTRRLSGGNQQKVCIARALAIDPTILFVSEPTRGIDVGAKKLVMETLVKLNKELGMTIIMTSSELAELRSVCDRIVIICHGQVEGILSPDDSDVDYGLMMSGDYHKFRGKGAAQHA
ncbi:MAG: ribose transport system ATP-binding protein [Bacillota bacterium]|nr:MAG: ribose transport system ATP-binding protein [Bacillota bacterium]MBS3949127.1 sugar ABC transporter ATP-binding protein [Peptococcaceae bacterium]